MQAKLICRIAEINAECFTSDDKYSSVQFLQDSDFEYKTVWADGIIVGYIIYRVFPTHIESLRRAVTNNYRCEGYGLKLSKALTRISNKTGKSIYTYVSKTNMPSLNSNIKVGYRIEGIDEHWVYIRYKPPIRQR